MGRIGSQISGIPVVAMRGVVVFPEMVIHFDVAREKSTHAVSAAYETDRQIFLIAQNDVLVEEPTERDLYTYGVIAVVRQVLKTPDGVMRILVEGTQKAKLEKLYCDESYYSADIRIVPYRSRAAIDAVQMEATVRSVKDIFEEYSQLFPRMPKDMIMNVMCQDDPYKLFNSIIFNINLDYKEKQKLLEENHILLRLTQLYHFLKQETQVVSLEREIQEIAKENMDHGQREYYLREQMNVIASQLGEDEDQEEMTEYLNKIQSLQMADVDREKLLKELNRLGKLPPASQEAFVIRSYLDTVLALPWNTTTKTKINLEKAQTVLDKDHYGMKKVKERILESIAVHALQPNVSGQIICLVGPPGVGKTSIGKSVAKALGRKYERISLGGVRDEADIRGHRKTYLGAMPGRVIEALNRAGTSNPLLLLDEIDKMSNDFKGDPSAALLEVLDSEQNKSFRDHYIEVPFDLSKVLFIATANDLDYVPEPLLDRMEVIELSSYTREEKFQIAKNHLVSKQIKKHGLKASQVKFSDDALYTLIDHYTYEAGVRSLERTIASLCRKAAKKIVGEESKRVSFSAKHMTDYLGPHKLHADYFSKEPSVGIVNGMAWTSYGGSLLPLEVIHLPGTGKIEITGRLGEVMTESARIAISYVRSIAERFQIPADFQTTRDLHIHAPEGAVPKDGPSAGVTLVTALVSALSGIPARSDVAMTGEITLHGKVLPIGGLREKAMAAYTNGIRTILIPKDNVPDLYEVDDVVKEHVTFVPAETLDTVLEHALVHMPQKPEESAHSSEKPEEQPEKKTEEPAENPAETVETVPLTEPAATPEKPLAYV